MDKAIVYKANFGYGLQFGDKDILYRDTKESIIRLADTILYTIANFSLLSELNNMQAHSGTFIDDKYVESETFKNKFEIPSYFINLILKDYNMKVLGW